MARRHRSSLKWQYPWALGFARLARRPLADKPKIQEAVRDQTITPEDHWCWIAPDRVYNPLTEEEKYVDSGFRAYAYYIL